MFQDFIHKCGAFWKEMFGFFAEVTGQEVAGSDSGTQST